jgi:hypothetical protein
MKIQHTPGSLKRVRRPSGQHQHTFRTALDRLPVFVAGLLAGTPPIASGTVILRAVVFEPRHVTALLKSYDLIQDLTADVSITASGAEELQALLIGAFSDWLDFYFVPNPHRFLVYADHDEYTTVFASRRGAISRIATAMSLAGISDVTGYTRDL